MGGDEITTWFCGNGEEFEQPLVDFIAAID